MKKKRLKQRIRDLEYANQLMIDILSALFEKQKPTIGHKAMFALRDGMTAEEAESLDEFWAWVHRKDIKTVTQEDLVKSYADFMPPRLQGKLPQIADAEIRDGMRVRLGRVALGLSARLPEDDEEDTGDHGAAS